MKSLKYILIIIIAILTGCEKDKSFDNTLQQIKFDSIFINTITDKDYTIAIHRIDSLLDTKSFSKHKTALLYYEKGNQYYDKVEIYKALVNYKLALEYFKAETQDNITIGKIHLALGDIYSFTKKNELANNHLLLAKEILVKVGNKNTESQMLAVSANIKLDLKEYDTAMLLFSQNTQVLKKLNKYDELSINYFNMSMAYHGKKDFKNFIKYSKKSIKIAQEHGLTNSYSQRELAQYYYKNKNYNKAFFHYNQALKNEKGGTENLAKVYQIYLGLKMIATKKQNYKLAIKYYTIIDSLNRVKTKISKKTILNTFDNKYDLIVKENEIIKINSKKINTRIIYLSFIGLLLYISLFLYNKNKNTKLKMSRDKIRLEQRLLRSQMNPHFIFNTLTAIQNSVMDNDPLKSVTYISKFSKLIRQNFNFVTKKTIYLNEEIDALTNYLDTQKFRLKDEFDYVFNIADTINTREIKIPPLLIQPFIENAIEHGFKHHKKQGLINIGISKQNNFIHFEIKDNGTGFETSKKKDGKSHAIDIFKKRLILLQNKDEKSFKIVSSGNGTTIKFSLKQC